MELRNFLGLRPKADGSAELRDSLARTEAEMAAVRGRIAEMEAARGGILLDGAAADIAAHEAALAAARGDGERLASIAAALPARIAEAEARERAASLDRLTVATERYAAEAAGLVPDIVAAVERLGELVQRHDALAQHVQAGNRELRAGGRERITPPLLRAWPHDPNGERVHTLGAALSLPGPRGGCATLKQWQAEVDRATAA